jgi:hypothetical protein
MVYVFEGVVKSTITVQVILLRAQVLIYVDCKIEEDG